MAEDLCPNKEVCGSCKWSHIPYKKQLEQKLSDINGSFRQHGVTYECTEILPAPQTAHYRNRMDFAIDFEGRVGLREKGKWWRVLDGHHCFISDTKIEEIFHIAREWAKSCDLSFFDRKKHHGLLRYAVIRTTLTNQSLVTIITSDPSEEETHKVKQAITELAQHLPNSHVVWSIAETVSDTSRGERIERIQEDPFIIESIRGYHYRIHPFTFFQTNSTGAEILLDTVQDFASEFSGGTFLDLYCGSGFFTIPLSDKFSKTIGVELEPEAVEHAVENALLNKREIEFVAAKTEEYDWRNEEPTLVLVDPPRMGLHDDALKQLKESKTEGLLYVSCNYKALARELNLFKGVFEVEKMKAIDMFPHTPHVEVVTLLQRVQR